MKILVTGHTGFVGRAVTSAIRAYEHQVVGVSRTVDNALHFQQIAKPYAELSTTELNSLKLDAVIHCAWIVTPGIYLESAENIAYANESLSFLSKCTDVGVPRFLGVGSCAELVKELDSPYSQAKSDFRKAGQQMTAPTGTRFDWAYLFYPYGPGEHADRLTTSLIQSLRKVGSFTLDNPSASKDYIFIDDVADALVAIATRATGDSAEFQVGSGQCVTIEKIAKIVATILQLPTTVIQKAAISRGDPVGDVIADIDSLRAIGWTPQIPLESGLEKLSRALIKNTSCKS